MILTALDDKSMSIYWDLETGRRAINVGLRRAYRQMLEGSAVEPTLLIVEAEVT
jgi:hypothetical protein